LNGGYHSRRGDIAKSVAIGIGIQELRSPQMMSPAESNPETNSLAGHVCPANARSPGSPCGPGGPTRPFLVDGVQMPAGRPGEPYSLVELARPLFAEKQ
jgi:hypothetical protein